LKHLRTMADSSTLPMEQRHFVGRRRELAALHGWLVDAADGAPSAVSIFGPPGIGKTRLLAEFERAEGLPVFRVQCTDSELEPLTAVRELLVRLRSYSCHSNEATSSLRLGQLFARVLCELREICASQVGALAIEDIHWASPDVRALVNYLVDAVAVLESKPQLLFLLTFRDFSVTDPSRAEFIEKLLRPPKHVLQLPPLSGAEIGAMIPPYRFREHVFLELVRLSEGNPLYVEELIPVLCDGEIRSLPSRAQTATRSGLAALSPGAKQVLYAASVIGVDFSFRDVAALCDIRGDALIDALQEASDGRFVQQGSSESTYRFRHALIREIIYNELVPANAIRLHRRAAHAIARLGGCRTRLAELAAHSERAGWSKRASILFLRSGEAAERLHDFESAATAYRRARSNAPPHDPLLALLAAGHANCLFLSGALDEAADAYAEAARLYERLGLLETTADLVRQRSVCLERLGDPRMGLRELEASLLRAISAGAKSEASIVLAGAQLTQAYRPLLAREYEKWRERLDRLCKTSAPASDRIDKMKFDAISEIQEGRWSNGMRTFDRALETAARAGDPVDDFYTAVLAAKYHAFGGNIPRAAALFRYAYVIGEKENGAWMHHLAGTRLARLLLLSGSLSEARMLLERCIEVPAYSRLMQISVATNAVLLGVLQNDSALVERFLDQQYIEMGLEYPSSAVLCDIGFSYGVALRSRNRMDEARELVSRILPRIDQPWEARPFLAMAPLWGAARDANKAQQLLTASMHIPGAPGYVHLCRAYARNRANDSRARQDARLAAHEFHRSGLKLLEARAFELANDRKLALALYHDIGSVHDLARLAGLRTDSGAFTIRQRQIADLVVNGYSNKAIAETLGIAPGTVSAHLAAVYRRMGVTSRTQLLAKQGIRPKEMLRTV
jgi:DNA-binding CsgD family transcriptional regulator/tetratricopeptide (TPR) repeat protein